MALSYALILALLLDAVVGDPRRWHPLAGFGALADTAEIHLNRDSRLLGGLAVLAFTLLPALATGGILHALPPLWGLAGCVLVGSLCLGGRSLAEHVRAVARPLATGDLRQARNRVACLVSRETEAMDALAIRRATIESLLENASDAVFAALFWFAVGGLVAGPAGAAALILWHRLVNTLDAMWGYRSRRLVRFGWAAARLDDGLNWLPARLAALALAAVGQTGSALRCWRRQAADCASPNGGVVMSAGAGALEVRLGGGAWYRGVWEARPWLGCGAEPTDADIRRALELVVRALGLFCLVIVGVDWLI